jgi:hypothetical protein
MMITLYYVFDTSDASPIVERDRCVTTINVSRTEDVEDALDMSLLDFLHEPVKIVFTYKDAQLEALVKTLANKYDVSIASYAPQ